MSESAIRNNIKASSKTYVSPGKEASQNRINRLKEIDAIYKSQIQQIYSGSTLDQQKSQKVETENDTKSVFSKRQQQKWDTKPHQKEYQPSAVHSRHNIEPIASMASKRQSVDRNQNQNDFECLSSSSRALQSVISESKLRASRVLQGESTRALQLLRKENENKQIKIRQLTSKCEYLLQKLKKTMTVSEYEQEVQTLSQFCNNKIQRFENLFKIKNEELFFKMKLQVVSLLQEFSIATEELGSINDIQTESALFAFMSKKLKSQLKVFRIKEQQNSYEMQKEKILTEKYEERIHHLTETNELIKLNESKLKQKQQELKDQLTSYIGKLRQKEISIEELQSENFRLKRQLQGAHSSNKNYRQQIQNLEKDRSAYEKQFQAKQKEMKMLLQSYNIEKKSLQDQLQGKQSFIQQILIKEKYLTQENERLDREVVRVKERYEWLQKDWQQKQKEFEEERQAMVSDTEAYKAHNNQGLLLEARAETQEALRRIEEYQVAYDKLLAQLQDEKRVAHAKQQEHLARIEQIEEEWMEKGRAIEKVKEEEILELQAEFREREKQLRREYAQKEDILSSQIQGKMKALLAQKDKKVTQRVLEAESETERIKKELQSCQQLIYVLQQQGPSQSQSQSQSGSRVTQS